MAPKRRREVERKPIAVPQEVTTTNDSPVLMKAPSPFIWTTERTLALLNCMIGRKPAGLHKHVNMMLIKTDLSKRLNMDVPTSEIWRFIDAHWDINLADKIEYQVTKIKPKDFELPKTEEWEQLVRQQGENIKKMEIENKKKEVKKQPSHTVTSSGVVDLSTLKTVKIMVERMNLYTEDELKEFSKKSFNQVTTLEDGQTKSTSSNVNIDVNKKRANSNKSIDPVVVKNPKI